jgi:acrylyl-CoA reductase (NADPH)
VKIAYSSLNYKDALAVTGAGKVVRRFPMIPGIDFVGTVEHSETDAFSVGDQVILTGWGVGESHEGGYAEYARVKSEWLLPLPDDMTPEHAMTVGTAGLTSMLAALALQTKGGITPADGEILVTGASGGTGSLAVAILAGWDFTVVASTGREQFADYLKSLGAHEVIGRFGAPKRPMGSGRWAGAVDGVGGDTLANVLSTVKYGGSVAAYGLAGGTALNTTVLPFILRGITLFGIDSVMCPLDTRHTAWKKLALDVPAAKLDTMTRIEPLSDIEALSQQMLDGQIRGRVVIDVSQ